MFYFESIFKNQVIRNIEPDLLKMKSIFLTFDDGPNPDFTHQVLDILLKYKIKATFFLIADNVKLYPKIVNRIIQEGHSIGDHSIDHNTQVFFKSQDKLKNWKESSNKYFISQDIKTVGFRSPLGINTPKLNKIMAEENEPLILWNIRFFDTIFALSRKKIKSKLSRLSSGDIILLHDVQRPKFRKDFLVNLEYLIEQISKEFTCIGLTKELVRKSLDAKR